MECKYEIRLSGRVISIDRVVWENIRDHVRDNKWFVIVYMNKRYKYTKDQTFFDRPTRFEFEVSTDRDEIIDIIYI